MSLPRAGRWWCWESAAGREHSRPLESGEWQELPPVSRIIPLITFVSGTASVPAPSVVLPSECPTWKSSELKTRLKMKEQEVVELPRHQESPSMHFLSA